MNKREKGTAVQSLFSKGAFSMKTLDVKKITEAIRHFAVEVNTDLPKGTC